MFLLLVFHCILDTVVHSFELISAPAIITNDSRLSHMGQDGSEESTSRHASASRTGKLACEIRNGTVRLAMVTILYAFSVTGTSIRSGWARPIAISTSMGLYLISPQFTLPCRHFCHRLRLSLSLSMRNSAADLILSSMGVI